MTIKLGRNWTEQDAAYVAEHCRYQTSDEIAVALGKTPKAVRAWMQKRGIRSGARAWTSARRAMRSYMLERAGILTYAQIARESSLKTRQQAARIMRRMGLGQPDTLRGERRAVAWYGDMRIKWTPEEFARLEELKKGRAGITQAPTYGAHDWLMGRGK